MNHARYLRSSDRVDGFLGSAAVHKPVYRPRHRMSPEHPARGRADLIEHGDAVPGERCFLYLDPCTVAERCGDGVAVLLAELGSTEQHLVEADHEGRERTSPVEVAKGADRDAG